MTVASRVTLRTIIEGSSNRRALELVRRMGRSRVPPNPVALVGCSSVGKSHIMHVIAASIRRKGSQVLWVTAEEFCASYVTAIRSGHVPAFRHRFDAADALFIDAVEDFATRLAAFEELLRAIRLAVARAAPVVLACGPAFGDELAAVVREFPRGAYAEIRPPTLEQRRSALELHARSRRRYVPRARLASIARASATIPEARARLDAALLADQRGR